MPPKFGTSGLRGLVTELTAQCVNDHIAAFIASCDLGTGLYLGHDLRDSSPDIAGMVATAARQQGVAVTKCGAVPTPALALAAMSAGAGAVMVTGSHIPADRNGLKFYTPDGEITKADESAILAHLGAESTVVDGLAVVANDTVADAYTNRYLTAFGAALDGMKIGLYAHSAVGRDMMAELLTRLGAEVSVLGSSDVFIPVDTEAVAPDVRQQLKSWASSAEFDAIVSTDADGDRPLVTDARGQIVPGDVLGQIAAAMLKAEVVVTPISSNTGVEAGGKFEKVIRTKIGSPYVIAEMAKTTSRVVGYEANGGFLLGYDAMGPCGPLPKLITRDALSPMLCCLSAARGKGVSAVVSQEPPRFTAADRLQDIPTESSAALVEALANDAGKRADFLKQLSGNEADHSTLDGLRMTLNDGRIVHLRPSGNAPELRLYVEADTTERAAKTLDDGLALLRTATADVL